MYLSIYSELEQPDSKQINEPTFFFSTKISLSEVDTKTNFGDLIMKLFRELELDPPSQLKGKVFYFKLFQIKYWAQAHDHQFFQTINIPSDVPLTSDLTNKEFPLPIKKDGTFRIHFYATHKHVGNIAVVNTQ
jgi:hypothetical protein